jgi:hypothetical protein
MLSSDDIIELEKLNPFLKKKVMKAFECVDLLHQRIRLGQELKHLSDREESAIDSFMYHL